MFVARGATWGGNTGGGGQMTAGRFMYHSGPGGAPPNPAAMQQAASMMQIAMASGVLILALPAVIEFFIGYMYLGVSCDQPLAYWLLMDGGLALGVMVLILLLYCRAFSAGDNQYQQTMEMRGPLGGVAVAQYEERNKQMNPCEACLFVIVQFSAIIPLVSFVVGCVMRNGAEFCDRDLMTAAFLVIVYKPLAGIGLCCCWPCCIGCLGLAAAPGPAMYAGVP